ncbi:DUF3685 domain-containing protein [Almyronema epifaneia]|uniref:DUF3685 domain-containing protein n=1 Tax=Almyronema epifaneia S1 TaxID=2991925 RepID=A0ABW6IL70_9CYAN
MSDRPLQLMLIDDDPVFRLGLRIWLEHFPDFEVMAEVSTAEEALQRLGATAVEPSALPTDVDLVILDLGLGHHSPTQVAGLRLCQTLRSQFPHLPILVLSAHSEPILREAALQAGASEYGLRGLPVQQLVRLVRQTALGQNLATPAADNPAAPDLAPIPGPLTAVRISLRLSHLRQIEAAMTDAIAQHQAATSPLYRAVMAGRYRELRAAKWLINRLLATPRFTSSPEAAPPFAPEVSAPAATAIAPTPSATAIAPVTRPEGIVATSGDDISSFIFESVFRKLQTSLVNRSSTPLEIDILRPEKRRELLYIVLRQLETLLEDVRYSQLQPGQLVERRSQLLADWWAAAVTDFFGKYYTLQIAGTEQGVVPQLLEEKVTVQAEILDRIPLVPAFLDHLLFQSPLLVEGTLYPAASYQALTRSQQLLENCVLQVANSVVQPLLNRFADVETLKKNLYHPRLLSTREMTRFRNELAWRYRWNSYVSEPKAIFESQYVLLVLTERGIQTTTIYAPRSEELNQLSGVRYAVTLAIEARDAIAPRFRAVVSLVGNGLVYVLTEVVGRGIGLVGRGILQGIGNAWQDSRFKRQRGTSDK